MKKGFTLVELLMVVVLVGILVLVALPKYQTALERGRALEGVHNACQLTEYLEIQDDLGNRPDTTNLQDLGLVKSKFCNTYVSGNQGVAECKSRGWDYTIIGHTCHGADCEKLGLVGDLCGQATSTGS